METIRAEEVERRALARYRFTHGETAPVDSRLLAVERAKIRDYLSQLGHPLAPEPPAKVHDHEPVFGDRSDWRNW